METIRLLSTDEIRSRGWEAVVDELEAASAGIATSARQLIDETNTIFPGSRVEPVAPLERPDIAPTAPCTSERSRLYGYVIASPLLKH